MGMVQSKTLWTIGLGVGALYYLYSKEVFHRWGFGLSDPVKPIRGLRNIGSTCYLNAVLQALSACSYFSAWLAHKDDLNKCDFPPRLHHPDQYAGFDYPMIAVLYRAILVINRVIGLEEDDCDLMSKVPRDIIQTLHSLNHKFVNHEEQDTFECLQHLLTVLQQEVVRSVYRRQKGSLECIMDEDDASEVSGELISASEVDNEIPAATSKAINGIFSKRKASADMNIPMAPKYPFRGMTASVLQCLQCLHKLPVKFETFESLTLLLPHSPLTISNFQLNVRSLLRELQKPVIVTQVNCDGCSKKQGKPMKSAFSKTLYFARLPYTLVFHILQSEWRPDGLSKRHVFVRYDERLNAGDLHHWNLTYKNKGSGDSALPSFKTETVQDLSYDLKAIVAHSGDADSGHFITCRRVPDTPANVSGCRWAFVSDEFVSELQDSEPFRFKPYLLFYEKRIKRDYAL
ncbi:ubiquitin carboxyl-terminal hydrolase 30 homolog isoform X2 [Folsomia candida]|uniref:ubiquitin carboxyl-terminal hydrolase 30 homolog isoform X2 n=1 Tax=Folsomia candida TaxID=158441 RepID=UPI000B8FD08B|nr:ubiquitin carboxyl-terminal hydrolase 30 homolog isoform X2 [Folsomia candida]